ncbi:hypothetical protein [Streptomyces longispororuber]|uniref:hypothetical protein n=1 Tax=Streptomyces longispororuber TaxID=68230 RepID=UPI00210A4257|nr:hypothetical protein [Streptomyces longispororuber]MCQ4212236.1 hypothetical protein [Streptomyces longispororuber]
MTNTNEGLDEVRGALREAFDDVGMAVPVERIEALGRARRRRRRVLTTAGGCAAVAGLVLAVPGIGGGTAPPAGPGDATGAGAVHVRTAAYTVDTKTDGTVHVTWDKARYFTDHAGLEQALDQAGFPVLIKEGEFCKGPGDGDVGPSGIGPGVDKVMRGERVSDDRVTFVFTPSAMPAGKQLFIGYLDAEQLKVTDGRPGSVERLVPTDEPLTCTTRTPPKHD